MTKERNEVQTILVTGGAGYIGSRLIRDLAMDNRFPRCRIRIYDNLHRHHYCGLMDLPAEGRYEFIDGDVLDRMNLGRAMQGVSAVVHLAAMVRTPLSFDHPEWTKQINHWGTANVVECAVKCGVTRLVYSSSASVYGPGGPFHEGDPCRPVGPYATSKLHGEGEVLQGRERGLEACIVRLGTVFGNSSGMRFDAAVDRLTFLVGTGGTVTVYGSGEQIRPLIHIADASEALRTCLAAPGVGKIINASTLSPSVNEIVQTLTKIMPETQTHYTDQDLLTEISFEVDSSKLANMGFISQFGLEDGLREMLARWQGFCA